MAKARVRRYRQADRKAVIAAFRSNVPDNFPAAEESWLRSCLDEPDGPLFVIVEGTDVIGFGGYEISRFYNTGTMVFGLIRADRQRAGLGRMLMAHRLAHMARNKNRPRYAVVDTTPHMAGFFERCGFQVFARWPGGYRAGFDRVDLRMELTDEAIAKLKFRDKDL